MNKFFPTIMACIGLVACHRESVPDAKPAPCPAPAQVEAAAPTPASAYATPPANAVQSEMRLLTAALQSAVLAIGQRDVRGIKADLHRVHQAKAATDAALTDGSYRLPQNPEQLETFRALDEAFHKQLGQLVAASRNNDVPAATQALGTIVQSCEGCHTSFRPPPTL